MRILLLSETLCAGGAEIFVVRLANALAKTGNQVMIAVMNGGMVHRGVTSRIDPAVAVEMAFQPVKRTLLRADRVLRMLRIDLPLLHRMQSRWLEEIVRRWKPDVVHSHLVKADWLAASVKASTGSFRHVLTVHGEQLAYSEGTADPQMLHYDRKLRDILAQADGIALISDQQEEHFRDLCGISGPAITRIYNGYERPDLGLITPSRAELGLPQDRLIFGMVSRGIADKGWDEAIQAFQRLGRDDVALVLVGEGPFFDQLDDPPPGVMLAGFSANPMNWIGHFDVGLLPSRCVGESLPTVIVEYLTCGLPVIASDIGEIPKMLLTPTGELSGMLVPHADGGRIVDELASNMALLAGDAALRQRMGALALEAASKFDMASCIEQYLRLYRPGSQLDREAESREGVN